MIDTSVLIAGLLEEHELHTIARPWVVVAAGSRVPGIVLAEAWSALRRAPWNLETRDVEQLLRPWMEAARIVATAEGSYLAVLRQGRRLDLGGNIHDVLIAYTCAAANLPLTTLDRRQAALARDVPGLDVTLILPDEGGANGAQ